MCVCVCVCVCVYIYIHYRLLGRESVSERNVPRPLDLGRVPRGRHDARGNRHHNDEDEEECDHEEIGNALAKQKEKRQEKSQNSVP